MLKVRLATPEDAPGISQVHLSDVVQWYRWQPDLSKVEARPEDLTPGERMIQGGSWVVPGACRAHIVELLGWGQWPLVAELDGRVVGEMEVIAGPDVKWGRTAHIDVLVVAKDLRGRGIGRALVAEGERLARESGCDSYTVNPEDLAVGFYQRCDLTEVWARQQAITLSLESGSALRPWTTEPASIASYDPLMGDHHLLGRFQTSFDDWLKSRLAPPQFELPPRQEDGWIPGLGAHYHLRQDPRSGKYGYVYAWAPAETEVSDLLSACAARARRVGYQNLLTTVDPHDLPELARPELVVGKESLILGRSLRAAGGEFSRPSPGR